MKGILERMNILVSNENQFETVVEYYKFNGMKAIYSIQQRNNVVINVDEEQKLLQPMTVKYAHDKGLELTDFDVWVSMDMSTEIDMINHPKHYNAYNFEVIDVINQVMPHYDSKLSYHIGNVIKYILRAPFKGNLKQDLQKAQWYLNQAIKNVGE